MDWASVLYLGITFGLFVLFAIIVVNTYNRKLKDQNESAKYRMLDDD